MMNWYTRIFSFLSVTKCATSYVCATSATNVAQSVTIFFSLGRWQGLMLKLFCLYLLLKQSLICKFSKNMLHDYLSLTNRNI